MARCRRERHGAMAWCQHPRRLRPRGPPDMGDVAADGGPSGVHSAARSPDLWREVDAQRRRSPNGVLR